MLNAREPGREFASWTLALVLLFTASCSSNFWQSQQASAVMASLALTCSSSRNHNQSNDFSMSVRGYAALLSRGCRLYWDILNPLCPCVLLNFQRNQAGCEVPISCCPSVPERGLSDLMTSCKFPLS